MDYLKAEQHYIDLYDLFTIEECLDIVQGYRNQYNSKETIEKFKDLAPEEIEKGFNQCINIHLWVTKGERYRSKKERISGWMESDRVKQEKLDECSPPIVICPDCNADMEPEDFKHLVDYPEDQPMKVLFIFECHQCKCRKGIYENGEERVFEPNVCPDCETELRSSAIEEGEVATITTSCPSCLYEEVDVTDWAKNRLEREEKKNRDKELLDKYRDEFCLNDEDGEEYIDTQNAMKVANVVKGEEIEKYGAPEYEQSLELEEVKVADLEKLLTELLEKANFAKISFENPKIGPQITMLFSLQDADSSRNEETSKDELTTIITDALEHTNWRLVSKSVLYRLGFLEGQLKGYEGEEELLQLTTGKPKSKPKPKIDQELRGKYSHHNLVQLARLFGRMEGVENMRKRRLKKEPEGFYLKAQEGPYSCSICGENRYGNEIWWNLDGLRCNDCWRNIKDGTIPNLEHHYDKDKSYITDWEIQSKYGVHPSTRGKLRREGILIGRDLKNKDGSIYHTVYLKEENQLFLSQYTRNTSD